MRIRSCAYRPLAAAVLALAAALPCTALAVGTEFTWQGELRESGQPATGVYDLEFRLYAAASGGSPVGPTRTLSAQSISGGIYTALLDFGDQFTGEPRWLEISVRRAGQPTFTVLQPRQPLTATPYAQHADFVADNSIVGANIVDGSIASADIGPGAVTSLQIQNLGVTSQDLADGSVTTVKLADGAVAAAKLAAAAVGTTALADASVTAAKLAAGAVGSAQVNDNQIQRRVAARCPTGLPLIGLKADGAPVCDDTVKFVGPNLTRPRIEAFGTRNDLYIAAIDQTLDNLVFVNCSDPDCADGTEFVVLDTAIGTSTSVAQGLRGPLPFVAYHDAAASDLHAFDCNSQDCIGRTFRSLDTAGDAGFGVDVAIRTGDFPAIAYLDADSTPELRFYDCDDPDCATGSVRVLDTTNVDASVPVSMTLSVGDAPRIFYRGTGASQGLNVYLCTNSDCSSGSSVVLNSDDAVGIDSVARSFGRPLVSYTLASGARPLYVLDCTTSTCSSATRREISANSNTAATALALAPTGFPIIAYHGTSSVRVFGCADEACTSGTSDSLVTDTALRGFPAIDLRFDGRPMVVTEWVAVDGVPKLRIDSCGNLGCEQ